MSPSIHRVAQQPVIKLCQVELSFPPRNAGQASWSRINWRIVEASETVSREVIAFAARLAPGGRY